MRENETLGAVKEAQRDIKTQADRIDNLQRISDYLPFHNLSAAEPTVFPVLVQIIGSDKSNGILRKLRGEDSALAECLIVKKNKGEWVEKDLLDNGCIFHNTGQRFDFLEQLENRLNQPRAYTASVILSLLNMTHCSFPE